ncbi:MAG: sulfotransferase [Gammaproteobacteria bacterium]|nr:sulfotransferase [Gammaproteobacteria bacterium]
MTGPVWSPRERPEWLMEVNRVGRGLGREGVQPVSFDIGSLHREASRNRGGLTDFGSDDYLEPLTRLVQAIGTEAGLHFGGALATRDEIVNALECRLWLADLYRRHPEIEQVEIGQPIFVGGMGRSGTSIVHETLAAAPDVQALATWEIRAPWIYELPPGERDRARDDAWRAVRHSWYGLAPELEALHQMGRDMPQECAWVLNQCFTTDYFGSALLYIPAYQRWMLGADQTPSYMQHRRFLKAIQWLRGGDGKRWILKTPTHERCLETIFAVYPDAQFVWTHRDPLRALASSMSILATLIWSRSDRILDTTVVAREALAVLPAVLERAVQFDRGVAKSRVSGVVYGAFQRAPVATLARVRTSFGLGTNDGILAAMQRYIDSRPQHASGEHRYGQELLGLDDLREARGPLLDYQKYFSIESEW